MLADFVLLTDVVVAPKALTTSIFRPQSREEEAGGQRSGNGMDSYCQLVGPFLEHPLVVELWHHCRVAFRCSSGISSTSVAGEQRNGMKESKASAASLIIWRSAGAPPFDLQKFRKGGDNQLHIVRSNKLNATWGLEMQDSSRLSGHSTAFACDRMSASSDSRDRL